MYNVQYSISGRYTMSQKELLYDLNLSPLYDKMREEYVIDPHYYRNANIKRGLRNEDGTAFFDHI